MAPLVLALSAYLLLVAASLGLGRFLLLRFRLWEQCQGGERIALAWMCGSAAFSLVALLLAMAQVLNGWLPAAAVAACAALGLQKARGA